VREIVAFLDSHLAPDAAVFDMTNSPGLFYFFAGRRPASRYFHVSLAPRESSQLAVLRDLEATRPKLVIVDSAQIGFGLPIWDGIANEVRHYLISYYVQSHYRPLAEVAGYSIWSRAEEPANPAVSSPPPGAPVCEWAYFPYFAKFAQGEHSWQSSALAPVSPAEPTSRAELFGWAGLAEQTDYRRTVYAAVDGRVVAGTNTLLPRGDVVERLRSPAVTLSGFRLALPPGIDPARVQAFARLEDGVAELDDATGQENGGAPDEIRLPDGAVLKVRRGVKIGVLERRTSAPARLGRWKLPERTARTYALQIDVAGRNKDASFELLDANGDTRVTFRGALAERTTLTVPVGACRSWRDRGEIAIRAYSASEGPIPEIAGVRVVDLPLARMLASP
jgi:hypothetical protein